VRSEGGAGRSIRAEARAAVTQGPSRPSRQRRDRLDVTVCLRIGNVLERALR